MKILRKKEQKEILMRIAAHTNNLVETSWNWGKFRVEDTRGYVRYFM